MRLFSQLEAQAAPILTPREEHRIPTKWTSYFLSTTKNAAKTPQINKRNRLPLSALRCHRDRLSTTILAPFLAVETFRFMPLKPLSRSLAEPGGAQAHHLHDTGLELTSVTRRRPHQQASCRHLLCLPSQLL